ncbi:MAG: DUF1800 family protein [Burkholderiales bacterium]
MNGESTTMSGLAPTRGTMRRRAAMAFCAMVAVFAASAAQAALTPVYRFYHLDAGRHFYTASEEEKAKVLTTYPRFAYEGVAFYAYSAQDPGTIPVYRFYHQLNGSHVYTASESEKASIIANFPVYAYEGVSYYAEGNGNTGAVPLYRLYNTKLGTHFFTTSQSEANNAVTQWPWFAYEGTVYFVRGSGAPGGNVAPVITLAASQSAAAVGTFITLTASASDPDGSVVKVEYFRDGVKFGETTKAPHQFGYSLGAAGIYNFSAVATDNGGMTGASGTISVTATASGGGGGGGGGGGSGNIAPTVGLTATSNSFVAGGSTSLNASPFDADGTIAKVEFYDDTTLLATVTATPYSYTFSSTVVGNHTLSAKVYDNMGATGTSNNLIVVVNSSGGGGGGGGGGNNQSPVVSLSASASAINAGGTSTLTAAATDPDGTIAKVEFYDGATLLGTDTTAPYSYSFSSSVVGAHSIKAIAYDNLGASTTSGTVTVQVNAVAGSNLPRITLSPSATMVAPGGSVTLTATATAQATGATISTVSFYMDGTKLADDTVTPYTYALTVPAGKHTIYATATDSQGNVKATLTQTVVGQTAPAVATTDPDVWRLLNQATFGASQAEAARVVSLGGISNWIDDQFTKPVSGYPDTKYNRLQLTTTADCTTQIPGGGNYPGDSPEAMCARDHLSLAMVQRDFFVNAVYAPDQLRQRVAWALSQIIVTSANEPDLSYAYVMSRYQNIMFQEAFGNFQTLLQKVSVNPAMGNYLDAVNNDKPAGTRVPNENYAREIMQLFSVGLVELNQDGTPMLDAQGRQIPTYGQAEIAEFARIFTGMTYADATNPLGSQPGKTNTRWYGSAMVPYTTTATTGHDAGAKTLLNGSVTLANQSAQQDFDAAVLNVFMHPNTPPFISKQLIQRLVTGNPSKAYVQRIAQVFENNGSGVRGDLRAVVKAILMDPEARGPVKTAADFGTLREPVLMVTGLIRALSGVTDGAQLATQTGNLGQNPYFSPTVFNYFPPDATVPGTSILAPEFAIHTTTTAVGRANLVYRLVYNPFTPDTTIVDSVGTRLFTDQFEALATTPAQMVTEINRVLAGGQFPAALEPTIVTAVNAVTLSATPTQTERANRVRMAVYLMASSYDYQVQR